MPTIDSDAHVVETEHTWDFIDPADQKYRPLIVRPRGEDGGGSFWKFRLPVIGRFMGVMAEAARILHTDKNFVYKVLGKYLRITDTKIRDSAYQSEIPALERRLEIRESALQASLDEIAPTDPRAKSIKPQDLIDLRYLIELEKSGAFGK